MLRLNTVTLEQLCDFVSSLTNREKEILADLGTQGMENAALAQKYHITIGTVKSHFDNCRLKAAKCFPDYPVSNRVQLALLYREYDLYKNYGSYRNFYDKLVDQNTDDVV